MKDTKKATHVLLYGGLFLFSIIQCNAQGDTLRPYCMPIYKAWRITRDLSTLDRQSILLDSAGKVIQLKNVALKSAELALNASDSAYIAKDNEAKECRLMDGAKDKAHKQELKAERKHGRKEGAIVAGGIGLILLILVL